MITEAQALGVVSLATMKRELRIELAGTSHDALLTAQILAAVSYLSAATGLVDEKLEGLRLATVSLVRDLYDGRSDIKETSGGAAFAEVFRKLA